MVRRRSPAESRRRPFLRYVRLPYERTDKPRINAVASNEPRGKKSDFISGDGESKATVFVTAGDLRGVWLALELRISGRSVAGFVNGTRHPHRGRGRRDLRARDGGARLRLARGQL